jgi:hypothetical protein
MTPAEWQPAEGVVVVDVVARRLRGHPRGLLHGNSDDGERSVGSSGSSGATRRCFVQRNGMWNGWKYRRSIWKAATLRTPGYPALLGRCGAGAGAMATAIDSDDVPGIRPEGGGWGLGRPVG